jgi:hypothetical protein
MTLNVLRDEAGNMMSLIKYWDNYSSGNEPEDPIFTQSILNAILLNQAHLGW